MPANGFAITKGNEIKSWILLSIGLLFLVAGVCLGVSVSKFPTLLWNSATVSLSSATISLIVGGYAGWLLGWTQVSRTRIWVTILCVWAATPLIIQVSAWDALWGRLSWFSALVDVRYSRWFDGWLAVVWIHGFANVPWVALLVMLGRHWFTTDLEQYAVTERSSFWTLCLVTLPRISQLFLLAGMVVTIRVFEQFEVTDVYQVRTWAEIWYLGFSLGEFDQWDAGLVPSVTQLTQIMGYPFPNASGQATYDPAAVEAAREFDSVAFDSASSHWIAASMITPVLLLVGAVLILYVMFRRLLDSTEVGSQYGQSKILSPWMAQWSLLLTVGLPFFVLLLNLMVRAGVRVEVGKTVWSISAFLEMIQYSFIDYLAAGVWSFLMGSAAAFVVCTLAFISSWVVQRHRLWMSMLSLLAIVLFALPSPLISLHCFQQLNLSEIDVVRRLAATSIFAPAVALSFKYMGLGILLWMLVLSREAKARQDLLQLSSLSSLNKFWQFGINRYWKTAMGFGFFFLILAAGDLSTTFATVPPGMDTFPRRILGDLHAGAGSQVAAACLLQMVIVATASYLAVSFFRSSVANETE